MCRKLILLLGLALPALVLPTATVAEPLPPASQWISPDAVIALKLPAPKALLDLVLNPKLIEAVTSLPDYEKQVSQPGFQQFQGLIQYLEGRLQTDWKTGLRKLTSGGVTWAISPNRSNLVVVDAEDGRMLEQVHEVFLAIADREAAKRKQPGRAPSEQYQGVTIATLGNGGAHAIVGNRLLLSNRAEAIKAALDLRAKPGGESLASLPAYQAAQRAAGADATARLYVNLAMLNQFPPLERALENAANPVAALLSASVTDALRQSNWLSLALRVEGGTLTLQAAADGKPASSGAAAFASPSQPEEGALPNLSVPRRIAAASVYRDLHGFYAAKDKLFPERTSGLIFFENMMGIFFSGRDLTEEVLSQARPEIRFVVAEQQFDPAIGTPQVQLPAFAAIFRLRHPQEFGEVVEEAWQKALGLMNITSGQKALPGMIIDRRSHGDTRFSLAYYSAAGEKSKTDLDVRFNYRPALVRLGDCLILSSTDGLAIDLIDALQQEMAGPLRPLPQTHTLLEIDGAQVAGILAVNRQNLVRQNMVEKGNTPEQAEKEVGMVIAAMKYLDQLNLTLGSRDGQTSASLKVKLNLP